MKKLLIFFIMIASLDSFGQALSTPKQDLPYSANIKKDTRVGEDLQVRGGAVIGDTTLNGNASLELVGTTKGFLPNRGNTTQMNAIVLPANGLHYYNTDSNAWCRFDSGAWRRYAIGAITGTTGPTGANGSNCLTWTRNGAIGTGQYSSNSSTASAITDIYINWTTNNSLSAQHWLEGIDTGDIISVTQESDHSKFGIWTVNSVNHSSPVSSFGVDSIATGGVFGNTSSVAVCYTKSGASSGSGWSLTGNAGITSSNFLGTTDTASLRFKTKGRQMMYIDSAQRISIYNNATGDSIINLIGRWFYNLDVYDSLGDKHVSIGIDTNEVDENISDLNGYLATGATKVFHDRDAESFIFTTRDTVLAQCWTGDVGRWPVAELSMINLNTGLDIGHLALEYDSTRHEAHLDFHLDDSTGTPQHIHIANNEIEPSASVWSFGTPTNHWKVGYFDTLHVSYPKVYTALLSETEPTSTDHGPLIVGETYTISIYQSGDDFSNVADVQSGTINTAGCVFIATGTTPTDWSNLSSLVSVGNPIPTVLENTIGDIVWTHFGVGDYRGTLTGAFAANATVFSTNSPYYILTNAAWVDVNSIQISVSDVASNSLVDNVQNISIQIKVY